MIGKTLAHYEITGLLGKGGMGEVYRATDTRLKREIALKIVPADMAADADRIERFQREAEAVAALNHPHIVHLYSVEEADGVHFLTMELVEGMDLAELLGHRQLETGEVLEIATAIADALAYAHGKGIVHRDLKPSNLVRGSDGRMKVLDFGLAKMATPSDAHDSATRAMPLTGTDAAVGTIPYMSPEHLAGSAVDGRSDLFSLGIVLYELLTGRRPFTGNTGSEVSAAILRDAPPDPTTLRPELPPEWDRIIGRCLAKDPGQRYASAGDLRDALSDLRSTLQSDPSRSTMTTVSRGGNRGPTGVIAAGAAVAILAALFFFLRGGGGESEEIRSLAVLPFANRSGDPGQEYFSDGFTDQLTTTLSDVSALKVIARSSAATYKDTTKRASQIGAELGVDGLISGTVLRTDGRIRITAELISTRDETNLWAQSYERSEGDILKLQAEVARAITDAIALELSPADSDRLSAQHAVEPRAYDAYLRGRALWNERSGESLRAGLAQFQTAIELDPEFALAHVGLADSYIVMSVHGYLDPHKVLPEAKAAVRRAIELDPTAGEPHASLGDIYFHYDWDWEASEASLRRAIELSPGFATAHQWLSEPLLVTGRTEEAWETLEKARELDPMAMIHRTMSAMVLEYQGRRAEAIDLLRDVVRLNPEFPIGPMELARNLVSEGQSEEGLARARALVEQSPDYLHAQAILGFCLARAGYTEEARALLAELQPDPGQPFFHNLQLAKITAGLGDREATLRHLRAGVAAHEGTAPFLPVYDEYRFLWGDPEFRELLELMGVAIPPALEAD